MHYKEYLFCEEKKVVEISAIIATDKVELARSHIRSMCLWFEFIYRRHCF